MPVDRKQKVVEDRRRQNKIIKELRQHQQNIEDEREDAVDPHSDALTQHFQTADLNIEKTETVDHALLDAQIFHRLGQFSKKQAEQLQSGLRTYDVKTFTDSLITHIRSMNARKKTRAPNMTNLDDDPDDPDDADDRPVLDLDKFGNSVWKKFRAPPPMDSFYGKEPVESPVKERKARVVKKPTVAKLVKPAELAAGQVAQTETDKQVATMKRELKRRRQINFWVFVIDPQSFTRSVENVFHSSFLVKDQWAELDMKLEPPMLRYRDKDSTGPAQPAHPDTEGVQIEMSQFILGFDNVLWQEVIRKHKISKCILPRPSAAEHPDVAAARQSKVVGQGSAQF